MPELRAALLERQRALAAEPGGIVMAGRDIGTVVLPDADLKIFLDASVEERARRRAEERGLAPDSAEARFILAQLRRRDDLDRNRAVAPLRPADDAIHIVTDGNRFEETVGAVVDGDPGGRGRGPSAGPRRRDDDAADRRRGRPPSRRSTRRSCSTADLTPLIRSVAFGARTLARCLTRVRVEGAIDAIPREGPVILAANHVSNADAVIIGAWLTPRARAADPLARQEARCSTGRSSAGWPATAASCRSTGPRPTSRRSGSPSGSSTPGQVLMVFPEGTRSPTGELQTPKDGLAMLALRTNATIVPIGVSNTDRVWPKGRHVPDVGGHATMRVGRAVPARGRAAGGPRPQVRRRPPRRT